MCALAEIRTENRGRGVFSERVIIALAAVFAALLPLFLAVPSSADTAEARGTCVPGFAGDESATFSPETSPLVSGETPAVLNLGLDTDSWSFSGVVESSRRRTKDSVLAAYAYIDSQAQSDALEADPASRYTEFTLDLSDTAFPADDYSTLFVGVSLSGSGNERYRVETDLYCGNERLGAELYAENGWNLIALDIAELKGKLSHLRVTVYYTDYVPGVVKISSPYVTKEYYAGFTLAERFLTPRLASTDGAVAQRSGRVRPDGGKASLGGVLTTDSVTRAGDVLYFEITTEGIKQGSLSLSVSYTDPKIPQTASAKISVSGDGAVVCPVKAEGEVYSFNLSFDNTNCDGYFTIRSIKLLRFADTPLPAGEFTSESGATGAVGSVSKITLSSDKKEVVFSGSMMRDAAVEYGASRSGDGRIRFFALSADDMDDISRAEELGIIKLTTVFEYTAAAPESVTGDVLYFAAVTDKSGNLCLLSSPRRADFSAPADSQTQTSLGLVSHAPVGAFEANASRVIVDFPVTEYLTDDAKAKGAQCVYTYTSETGEKMTERVYVSSSALASLDSDIAFYTSVGIKVYIRLLSASPENSPLGGMILPSGAREESRYTSVVSFLAERYPSAAGFILGRAVNDVGGEDVTTHLDSVIRALALTASASRTVTVLPMKDTGDDGLYSVLAASVILERRLEETGAIPWAMLYTVKYFDDDTSLLTRTEESLAELELSSPAAKMYLLEPDYQYLREKLSERIAELNVERSQSDDPLSVSFPDIAEYTAELYGDFLGREKSGACVFLSLEKTGMRTNHTLYSLLKKLSGSSGRVSDASAGEVYANDTTYTGRYTLFDFSDMYYTDGWITGGGDDVCMSDTAQLGANAGDAPVRVLRAQFSLGGNSSSYAGAAGIALHSFDGRIDLSAADELVFTLTAAESDSGSGEAAEDRVMTESEEFDFAAEGSGFTLVLVVGGADSRAEYYAGGIVPGREYTLSCPLSLSPDAAEVEYIGVMVYYNGSSASSDAVLEIKKVELYSRSMNDSELAAAFAEKKSDAPAVREDYRSAGGLLLLAAVITAAVLTLITRLEREENENSESESTERNRKNERGRAANERK